jgi:hypothetical protein
MFIIVYELAFATKICFWNMSEMVHRKRFVLFPGGNGESVFGESRACQGMLCYAVITTARSYSSIVLKAR